MGRIDEKNFFVFSGPQKKQKFGHTGNFFNSVPAEIFQKGSGQISEDRKKNPVRNWVKKKYSGTWSSKFFPAFFEKPVIPLIVIDIVAQLDVLEW